VYAKYESEGDNNKIITDTPGSLSPFFQKHLEDIPGKTAQRGTPKGTRFETAHILIKILTKHLIYFECIFFRSYHVMSLRARI
jgi:hypothetical protein